MKNILLTIFVGFIISTASCQKEKMTKESQEETMITINGKEYTLSFLYEQISISTGFSVDRLGFNPETGLFYLIGYDLELDPANYIQHN